MIGFWFRRFTRAPALLVVGGLALPSGAGLTGSAHAGDPSPPHSLGACGGPIVGADGQSYPCASDRKPACNDEGARCVCLEQRACGGKRDEPY